LFGACVKRVLFVFIAAKARRRKTKQEKLEWKAKVEEK